MLHPTSMETVVINGLAFRKVGERGKLDTPSHAVVLEETPPRPALTVETGGRVKVTRRSFLALALMPFAVYAQARQHDSD